MASSSHSASASCSTSISNSKNCYQFEVFINHRGIDVKKTFASHLYSSLTQHRLGVFLDKEEMQKGHNLTGQIEGAIRTASVHIAIFTTNYAQSSWCLDELVLMVESMMEKRSTILPIFFGIKPSEIRHTEGGGLYAQGLRSLQNKRTFDSGQPRYDSKTIGKWKKALYDVSAISGFELEEAPYKGDEEKLLIDVVERVLEIVPKRPLYVSKYPTGLDDKVKDFETTVLLQTHQESEKPRVVGIVGLGGVGKTTLAKEFFNRVRTNYRRSCFLSDVREKDRKGSLSSLQSILIKELTQRDVQINSIDEGISHLQRHLTPSHAIIIVDDVDHIDQLDSLLLAAKDVLGSGSLIIVTSRDKKILRSWGIGDLFIYKLQGLNRQHSTELFCLHAFQQPLPVAEFEQVVNEFLDACNGLPLSLKVIGALLYGEKNLGHWKAQLRKISKIPPFDIQNKLKISYDSLDEEEKQIFLDIACFFIEEDKDTAIRIWDGSGWEGSLGFQNIQNKSVVEVEEEIVVSPDFDFHNPWWHSNLPYVSIIRMHDQLRDLGRNLAHKDSSCRIWSVTENLLDQLPVRGIKNVEERNRLVTELRSRKCSCVESVFSVEQSPQLILLRWYNCPFSSLASKISMENLRVLYIEGQKSTLKRLWHEYEAPLQLRELHITGFSLLKIPDSIGQLKHLEKITVAMGFPAHRLETLPAEFCQLLSLKHLELRGCTEMKSLPDSIGDLCNLQHVDLSRCARLEMLPNSFGNLTSLQHVDLRGCARLKMLPNSFGKLANLHHIYLVNCRELQMLPNSFGDLTKLQHIDLTDCKKLQMLPNSFGNLTQLQYLCLNGCEQLTLSEETLGKITTLERLGLSNCVNIKVLPPQLTYQRFLRELYLKSDFKELPCAIDNLCSLRIFSIESSCLKLLPPSFGSLKSLEELSLLLCPWKCFPDSIGLLTQLKKLTIKSLDNLELLELKECPARELTCKNVGEDLETTTASRGQGVSSKVDAFEVSYSNAACPNLQYLEINECGHLVEAVALPTLTELRLTRCPRLRKLGGLCTLSKLQTLCITWNNELEELPSIEKLLSLEKLETIGCQKLKRIHGLAQLTKLQTLTVTRCAELEELPGAEQLRSLKMVSAFGCPKLQWGEALVERLRQRLKEGLIM